MTRPPGWADRGSAASEPCRPRVWTLSATPAGMASTVGHSTEYRFRIAGSVQFPTPLGDQQRVKAWTTPTIRSGGDVGSVTQGDVRWSIHRPDEDATSIGCTGRTPSPGWRACWRAERRPERWGVSEARNSAQTSTKVACCATNNSTSAIDDMLSDPVTGGPPFPGPRSGALRGIVTVLWP